MWGREAPEGCKISSYTAGEKVKAPILVLWINTAHCYRLVRMQDGLGRQNISQRKCCGNQDTSSWLVPSVLHVLRGWQPTGWTWRVQEARPVKTVKISVKEAKPLLGQDRRWGTFLYSIATDWVTGRSPTKIEWLVDYVHNAIRDL